GNDLIGIGSEWRCLKLEGDASKFVALRQVVPFVMPMLIGAAISLVIALVLAHRFVRPIQRLGDSLTALSQGDLTRRIGQALVRSEPAIADVGRAFDLAASTLQELTESRSRLFHDISHEIRSPLARLQVEIALLRQNPARLEAMLPRMDADIARTDHLVGEILMLARLERGGAFAIKPVAIDLIDLLDPILRDFDLEGQARGVRLLYTGPDRQELICDPELLHRAFDNIIRNALRYSPDDGTVDFLVTQRAGRVDFAISDIGPGIDPAQISNIFQAFVRDDVGGGAGLGLAIAENAVRLHGGKIWANNRVGGGLTINCSLPLAPHTNSNGIVYSKPWLGCRPVMIDSPPCATCVNRNH
ncbi:sensor histidine kinase, partial [Cereibacter changlensis]|uniref:sensor histidine kinase n=1 Tax=Cereibacter changlensis TaxID=402884 RepID=UPI0011B1FAA5